MSLPGTFEFRQAPLGAGGFVTGLDISADGSRMVHWTDVWNGYVRNANDPAWKPMFRADTLGDPVPRSSPTSDAGCYAARIAPSNKDVIYAAWYGFMLKTIDGGSHWHFLPGWTARRMNSNEGPTRRFQRTIDIDPADENTVIVGTNNDGAHYTTDGGKTWHAIAGLPATTTDFQGGRGKFLVGIDPGAPTNVYIHVFGTGLYRSTTGVSGKFGLVSGGAANVSCLVIRPTGHVYICQLRGPGDVPGLWTLPRGSDSWSGLAGTAGFDQVAINPSNPAHMVAVDENGGLYQSFDSGATWTGYAWVRGDGEIKWIGEGNSPMYPAMLLFDPVVPNKLWVADGVGVSYAIMTRTGTQVWHDHSQGNEELVPTVAFTSPGNPPILCLWDKPFWRMDDLHEWTNAWQYPVAAGQRFNPGFVSVGHSIDYAADDPQFLIGVCGQGYNVDGYSTDGGRSWIKLGTPCPGFGGWVAVSTKRNWIRTTTNNGGAYFTQDGGATWQPVRLNGVDPVTGWANAYYVVRQNITADKTRPGVFAALFHNAGPNNTVGNPFAGVWLTVDGGMHWVRQMKGCIQTNVMGAGSTAQFWQARFQYVPGFSHEILYADLEMSSANRLFWSKDDGANWANVHAAVTQVTGFGFGKAAPGQARPAVYFSGSVNGVRGVYASLDWFGTDPILLAEHPLDHIGQIADVNGDPNVFGRVFVGLATQGYAVCEYAKRFALV